MNENFRFINFKRTEHGVDFAGMNCGADGCIAATRQGLTAEDILYRVATITAVLFLLITML